MAYQIFIKSVTNDNINLTFMISSSFLSGKTKEDYITSLREINNNM